MRFLTKKDEDIMEVWQIVLVWWFVVAIILVANHFNRGSK